VNGVMHLRQLSHLLDRCCVRLIADQAILIADESIEDADRDFGEAGHLQRIGNGITA
jgi:hypothetical protein